MANPRVHHFDCSSWYWNGCKVEYKLKTKATVIPAKTIVFKDNGKIDVWDISTSKNTGPLYIVAEDTIADVDHVVCLYYGTVQKDALILKQNSTWETEKDGLTILDHIVFKSQIKLI